MCTNAFLVLVYCDLHGLDVESGCGYGVEYDVVYSHTI